MTRKRFIKLLMASGDYDRNLAVKAANSNLSSNNPSSYASMYEAHLYFSEAIGSIMVACDAIVENLSPALEEAADCCKKCFMDIHEALADSNAGKKE